MRSIRTQVEHHTINLRVCEEILAGREEEVLANIRAALLEDSTAVCWVRNLKGQGCAARPDYFADLSLTASKNRPWVAYYGRQLAVLEGQVIPTPEELLWLKSERDRLTERLGWAHGLLAERSAALAAVERKVKAYRDLCELGKLAEQLPRMRAGRNEMMAMIADYEADMAAVTAAIRRFEQAEEKAS